MSSLIIRVNNLVDTSMCVQILHELRQKKIIFSVGQSTSQTSQPTR